MSALEDRKAQIAKADEDRRKTMPFCASIMDELTADGLSPTMLYGHESGKAWGRHITMRLRDPDCTFVGPHRPATQPIIDLSSGVTDDEREDLCRRHFQQKPIRRKK